mgnify:CR=1 FL=1
MKILSIIDSFKGTFTSLEVSNIVKEELEKKGAEVTCIPISDGGEGFLEAYNYINKLPVLEVDTVDPLARPIKAKYLFDKENDFAVIELAQSSGITLIRHDERNPFITSTYGLGLVIKDAINRGAKNILIGIGGSASNDGGSGMLEALGVKFYDKDNNLITSLCNEKLGLIHHIDRKDFQKLTSKIRFDVCSDVTNPLLGENGATYVFAKQKGAKECDLELLENNMEHFSDFYEGITIQGSGAAGGVGYAFRAYFNSFFHSGIGYLLQKIHFNHLIRDYDYIVTGEGKIDKQSLNGKVISEIVNKCKSKRVLLLCAINELKESLGTNVRIVSVVGEKFKVEDSLNDPEGCLRDTIRRLLLG